MRPILAMIIPVGDGGGGYPDNSLPPGYGGRPDNSLPGGGPVDPGWGGGWGGGNYPSGGPIFPGGPVDPGYGRPGGPYPGNRPPGSWGGRPDQGLPGYGHPGNRPPGSGGGHPDQGLPWAPVRPDQGLPGEQPGIDNSLPGGWGRPDQGLPGAQPKVYAAAVPPTPPTSVNIEEGAWVIVNVNGVLAWAWAQKPSGGAGGSPDQELPETPEPK